MPPGNLFTTYDPRKIIRLLCICWMIMKATSFKLWLADRIFPLIPVNENLSSLPPIFHLLLLITSFACMAWLVVFPGKKMAMLLVVVELLSCLLDQNRWQPWEYQFICMIAVYSFINDEKKQLFTWQLIITGLYFFSGISKFNSAFIHDIWHNLFLRRWLGVTEITPWLTRLGYLLPLLEMGAAICLFFKQTRWIALWILITMHFVILLMLGPLGLEMNVVIWPWNVLMPLLLFILFSRQCFQPGKIRYWRPVTWLILVCWWMLPWLQLGGHWDKYLSSVLYSGGVPQLFICTDNVVAKKELGSLMTDGYKVIPCTPALSTYQWGIFEMKTAPYPESRIYKAIVKKWKERYPGVNHFYLYTPGFSYKLEELK